MPYYDIGTLGDWLFGKALDGQSAADPNPNPNPTSPLSASSAAVSSPSGHRRTQRTVQQKPWKIQHVLQQVLQGIAFLHQNHIIHRDIKYASPSILCVRGELCVCGEFVFVRSRHITQPVPRCVHHLTHTRSSPLTRPQAREHSDAQRDATHNRRL